MAFWDVFKSKPYGEAPPDNAPAYANPKTYGNAQNQAIDRSSYGGQARLYNPDGSIARQSGADQAVDKYQGLAGAAANRAAYQADYGQYNGAMKQSQGARGSQTDALGLQQQAAYGNAPSQAQLLGRNMIDQSLQAQMAGAASARGGSLAQAAAMRNAANGAAGFQQQGINQLSAMRANEMAQARDAYMGGASAMRSGDFQGASLNLQQTQQQQQNEQFQRELNQKGQMGYDQMAQQVRQDEMHNALGQNQINSGDYQHQTNLDEHAMDRDTGTAASIGSSFGSALSSLFSDERMKEDVVPLGSDGQEAEMLDARAEQPGPAHASGPAPWLDSYMASPAASAEAPASPAASGEASASPAATPAAKTPAGRGGLGKAFGAFGKSMSKYAEGFMPAMRPTGITISDTRVKTGVTPFAQPGGTMRIGAGGGLDVMGSLRATSDAATQYMRPTSGITLSDAQSKTEIAKLTAERTKLIEARTSGERQAYLVGRAHGQMREPTYFYGGVQEPKEKTYPFEDPWGGRVLPQYAAPNAPLARTSPTLQGFPTVLEPIGEPPPPSGIVYAMPDMNELRGLPTEHTQQINAARPPATGVPPSPPPPARLRPPSKKAGGTPLESDPIDTPAVSDERAKSSVTPLKQPGGGEAVETRYNPPPMQPPSLGQVAARRGGLILSDQASKDEIRKLNAERASGERRAYVLGRAHGVEVGHGGDAPYFFGGKMTEKEVPYGDEADPWQGQEVPPYMRAQQPAAAPGTIVRPPLDFGALRGQESDQVTRDSNSARPPATGVPPSPSLPSPSPAPPARLRPQKKKKAGGTGLESDAIETPAQFYTVSDERAKRGKASVADPMGRALDAMQPYAYRYKPGYGEDPNAPQVGPMAQPMARDPVASTAIVQDPRSGLLGIDQKNATKLALGGLGYLKDRQDATDRTLAALAARRARG